MFKNNSSPILQSIVYIFITYIFTWSFWIPILLQPKLQDTSNILSFGLLIALVGSFGPSFGAILTYVYFNGWDASKVWLRKCFNFKFGWKPFFMITLIPNLIGFILFASFNQLAMEYYKVFGLLVPAMMIIGPLGIIIGAGPMGEELGWRGFLTPTLLKKFNVYQTALIVGIIWSFWHLPLLLISEYRLDLEFFSYLSIYTLGTIFMSFTLIKLSQITKNSTVSAMLFHSVTNLFFTITIGADLFKIDKLNPSFFNISLILLFNTLLTACIFKVIVDSKLFKIKSHS